MEAVPRLWIFHLAPHVLATGTGSNHCTTHTPKALVYLNLYSPFRWVLPNQRDREPGVAQAEVESVVHINLYICHPSYSAVL